MIEPLNAREQMKIETAITEIIRERIELKVITTKDELKEFGKMLTKMKIAVTFPDC
jgi:hypothetical protein